MHWGSGIVTGMPLVATAVVYLDAASLNPESSYAVGTRAFTEAFKIPGMDKTVTTWEKKSNGRWLSQPGGDYSFSNLGQLASNTKLLSISGAQPTKPVEQPKVDVGGVKVELPVIMPAPVPKNTAIAVPTSPEKKQIPKWALWTGAGVAGVTVLGLITWLAVKR